jgi:hypothetical protein
MGRGSGDSHSGTHMHRESCRPAAGILPCSSRRPMRSSRRGVCHSRSCGCLGLPAAAKACCRLSLLGLLCLLRFLSCLGPTHTLWDCGRPGLQATVRTGQECSHSRSRLQVSSWYRGGLVCCIRAWGWFSHRAAQHFSMQRGCILAEDLVEQLLRQPLSDPCLEQGLLCLPCRSFRNVRDTTDGPTRTDMFLFHACTADMFLFHDRETQQMQQCGHMWCTAAHMPCRPAEQARQHRAGGHRQEVPVGALLTGHSPPMHHRRTAHDTAP